MNSPSASKQDKLAPVVLFAFNRPDHLRATLDALKANALASDTSLYVYADGARGPQDEAGVSAVRQLVRQTQGFKQVTLIERPVNMGLAQNIISGVTDMCERFGQVIVLEDDLVTAPYFLQYMNDALALYADDERVASIHGYVYPVRQKLPDTFFIRGADCWGWATWRRAWCNFNPHGPSLYQALIERKLTTAFNFGNNYPYMGMLEAQIEGRNNSWAIRWYASAFLADQVTLYPGQSLVDNIGNDNSGTHSDSTTMYDVALNKEPLKLTRLAAEESAQGQAAFADFMGQNTRMSRSKQVKAWIKYAKLRHQLRQRTRQTRRDFEHAVQHQQARLEGPFANGPACERQARPYRGKQALDAIQTACQCVREGYASFERHGEAFKHDSPVWHVLSALLLARQSVPAERALKVMDIGGGLGSHCQRLRNWTQGRLDVQWGVVETTEFVQRGQQHFADDQLSFFSSIDACATALEPDVILISDTLQYLPDPHKILQRISNTNARFLIIDHLLVTNGMSDLFMLEHRPGKDRDAFSALAACAFSRRGLELALCQAWRQLGETIAEPDTIASLTDVNWESMVYVRK